MHTYKLNYRTSERTQRLWLLDNWKTQTMHWYIPLQIHFCYIPLWQLIIVMHYGYTHWYTCRYILIWDKRIGMPGAYIAIHPCDVIIWDICVGDALGANPLAYNHDTFLLTHICIGMHWASSLQSTPALWHALEEIHWNTFRIRTSLKHASKCTAINPFGVRYFLHTYLTCMHWGIFGNKVIWDACLIHSYLKGSHAIFIEHNPLTPISATHILRSKCIDMRWDKSIDQTCMIRTFLE